METSLTEPTQTVPTVSETKIADGFKMAGPSILVEGRKTEITTSEGTAFSYWKIYLTVSEKHSYYRLLVDLGNIKGDRIVELMDGKIILFWNHSEKDKSVTLGWDAGGSILEPCEPEIAKGIAREVQSLALELFHETLQYAR